MLFLSLFLAGFTLGVFAALKIFAPERQEEMWDPQHLPSKEKFLPLNYPLQHTLKPESPNSPLPAKGAVKHFG